MRKLALLVFLLAPAAAAPPAPPDVRLYDELLQRHVGADGRVRYADLKTEVERLEVFVRQIGEVSPVYHPGLFPSRQAKLAYWINTYNALVLWAFARDYPEGRDRLKGLLGRSWFFYRRKFLVGGEKLSLASIENEVIRKQFRDPRIHFAINCASASCPPLAARAYTEANLEAMLERQTRGFLRDRRNVLIQPGRRRVRLSKLFDWYEKDFGKTPKEILAFVASYLGAEGRRLLDGDWQIRYFDYDWSLNDAAAGYARWPSAGLVRRHTQKRLDLRSHSIQRGDQPADIDAAHPHAVQGQPGMSGRQSQQEQRLLPEQRRGQVGPVLRGVQQRQSQGKVQPVKVLSQAPQISAENFPPFGPEQFLDAGFIAGL